MAKDDVIFNKLPRLRTMHFAAQCYFDFTLDRDTHSVEQPELLNVLCLILSEAAGSHLNTTVTSNIARDSFTTCIEPYTVHIGQHLLVKQAVAPQAGATC